MAELVKVKTERPDEAEIRELAAKMVEANKAKVLAATAAAAAARPMGGGGAAAPAAGGQLGILNFLTRKGAPPAAAEASRPAADPEKKTPAPDEASWKGHFGWDMLGKCHIPYIYRSSEKYVAVRMVEIRLLNKYLNYLHPDIYSCTCIRSYYITEIEARLLNEINNRHCDGQFGREMFTQKDLVVRLSDAYEFYNFLDVCYNKLLHGTVNSKTKCGFIRINKESVVPYTVRDNMKYVPLFYFEGETDNLKLKADQLKGWDLSYLKFCCKVQGIRNELFASETCSVISLTDIKGYFPPGTEFEEYWPNKVVDSQLLIAAKGSMGSSSGGQWTRAPPAPPPGAGAARGTSGGRRPGTGAGRTPAAGPAASLPHAGITSAAVQALASGWSGMPAALTHTQTQQVLRLAQAQVVAQAQAAAAAARYGGALHHRQHPHQHHMQHHQQQQQQYNNNAMSMAMSQQAPPPLVRSNNNSNMNSSQGSMNGHSSAKKLTPIPDINVSGNHKPYNVQKALVENLMVPCINAKPYQNSELLMTLPDLATHCFPRVSLATTRAMLDTLNITLYRPNSTQLAVLRAHGKCKSAAGGETSIALVQLRDVLAHMVQLKYMLRAAGGGGGGQERAPPPAHSSHHAKRARAN